MALVALLVGVVVAPVVLGVVYADAGRRGVRQRRRLLWACGTGLVSFVGFLLPVLFPGAVRRVYLRGIKPAPVVASPFELLVVDATVGLSITALGLLLYGVGSRLGSSPDTGARA